MFRFGPSEPLGIVPSANPLLIRALLGDTSPDVMAFANTRREATQQRIQQAATARGESFKATPKKSPSTPPAKPNSSLRRDAQRRLRLAKARQS
jgi:hypothetical protein